MARLSLEVRSTSLPGIPRTNPLAPSLASHRKSGDCDGTVQARLRQRDRARGPRTGMIDRQVGLGRASLMHALRWFERRVYEVHADRLALIHSAVLADKARNAIIGALTLLAIHDDEAVLAPEPNGTARPPATSPPSRA